MSDLYTDVMPHCARCGAAVSPGGEWIRVTQNRAHVRFESDCCSPACAVAYLEDGP